MHIYNSDKNQKIKMYWTLIKAEEPSNLSMER